MQYTGTCGYQGCQMPIKPADSEAQFRRNRGLHLRNAHGVKGPSGTPEGRRQAAVERYRQKKQAQIQEPNNVSVQKKRRKVHNVVDNGAVLKYICPECGCRIWTTKPM